METSAKELVTALVSTLWSQCVRVEYHLQEGGLDHRVGIACRSVDLRTGEETSVVMAPFSRDREVVMELIQRWNREQLPLQQFRDIILPGELWER